MTWDAKAKKYQAMASILAAMPDVVEELEEADGQRLVRITAIRPSDRFHIVDPRRDPPAYWPR